ncbi:hypothetical protein [Actinoalloteichus hymeniacidonis]|uniref:Cytidine deaminase n=1 Tax=Actinoalloteichus hymeniacidonis TaxID=340345 RepID=A0AAC9HUB5_9PSEU|nr:hypothetical protein [Actinoalloteichus hymeniacidonis]AOS65061.1 hypothetical protein TL08_21370 [Actinoalloteichus hymeniacidonis]MBB5906860.1 ligand-binding sensor domain-containing protein [Actinoalloteichus hymeniacidonis]
MAESGTDRIDALDPEDRKIITLAQAGRARVGATEGAAVRDTDGRTYSACTVELPSLRLTALQAAVAAAVASGATALEAAAVVGDLTVVDEPSRAVVRDLSSGAPIHLADAAGNLVATEV